MGTLSSTQADDGCFGGNVAEEDERNEGNALRNKRQHKEETYSENASFKAEDVCRFLETSVLPGGRSIRYKGIWKWFLKRVNQTTLVDATDQSVQEALEMKRACLHLAYRVNERATKAAELLGKLHVRTPEFFLCSNIIDVDTPLTSFSELHDLLDFDKQKEATFGSSEAQMMHRLDVLCKNAVEDHDGSAVEELLRLCSSSHLGGKSLNYIYNRVIDEEHSVAQMDLERMQRSGHVCALTAHWPTIGCTAPSAESFNCFQQANVEGRIERKSFHAITVQLHDVHVFQHKLQAHHSLGQKLKVDKDADAEEDKHVHEELVLYDSNFIKLSRRDPLVHLTPQVCAALLAIIEKDVDWVRSQVQIADDVQESQFVRVRAVRQIGKYAAGGNSFAEKLIRTRMIVHEHWLIQECAWRAAVSLLAACDENDSRIPLWVGLMLDKLHVPGRTDQERSVQKTLTDLLINVMMECSFVKGRRILDQMKSHTMEWGNVGDELCAKFAAHLTAPQKDPKGVSGKVSIRRSRQNMHKAHMVKERSRLAEEMEDADKYWAKQERAVMESMSTEEQIHFKQMLKSNAICYY